MTCGSCVWRRWLVSCCTFGCNGRKVKTGGSDRWKVNVGGLGWCRCLLRRQVNTRRFFGCDGDKFGSIDVGGTWGNIRVRRRIVNVAVRGGWFECHGQSRLDIGLWRGEVRPRVRHRDAHRSQARGVVD